MVGQDFGEGVISGVVYNEETEEGISNITVKLDREHLRSRSTVTDEMGYYNISVPSGFYTLRLIDGEGDIIFKTNFTISEDQNLVQEFAVDPFSKAKSKISGYVYHKITPSPINDLDVRLERTRTGRQYNTKTDNDGSFEFKVPAGNYDISVLSEDEEIYHEEILLDYEEEVELELRLSLPSQEFNWENVKSLFQENWVYIIGIIIVFVVGIMLVALVGRVFDSLVQAYLEKQWRFVDQQILHFAHRVVRWNILIIMIIVITFLVAQIFTFVNIAWIIVSESITSIYIIVLLIIFMRISMMIWKKVMAYLRGSQAKKPKKIVSARLLTIIEIIVKYILMVSFLIGILLTALAALGMSDMIVGGFQDFLLGKASFIVFIISLVIIAWIVVRFMTSFFEDMKMRSTRFRPEMIDIAGKGIKFFIYAIIGMILIFTILSAAGLGDIGQTLILVFSMIIGLVVSMAATGSIGNLLSGLVIMSFKPFEEGDWVVIANKYTGQIVESSIMFVKLKDLDDEIIDIPNNQVLSEGLVNWTAAAKRGGFAIEIDATIGYDVPAEQVIELMINSTKDIPGILKKPEPKVVTTDFFNHAIGYKLRAYIDTPGRRFVIRTDVMVNMQKVFTEAGVEILSPEFTVWREEKIPTKKQIQSRMKKVKEKAVEVKPPADTDFFTGPGGHTL